jgi:hypothetical protein
MICNHRTCKYLAENMFALPQNMIYHDFTNQKPWMLPAFCQNWVLRMIRMVGLIPVHQQRPAFCWSFWGMSYQGLDQCHHPTWFQTQKMCQSQVASSHV